MPEAGASASFAPRGDPMSRYTDDDVIGLKARYAVGIMRDGAMVETVVYPDGTKVHVADLDEAVRNGDHIDTGD